MPKKFTLLLCATLAVIFLQNCAGTGGSQERSLNVEAGIGSIDDVVVFPQLAPSNAVRSVAFSPDGKQVLSGSNDKTIKLWDTATGREIRTLKILTSAPMMRVKL